MPVLIGYLSEGLKTFLSVAEVRIFQSTGIIGWYLKRKDNPVLSPKDARIFIHHRERREDLPGDRR